MTDTPAETDTPTNAATGTDTSTSRTNASARVTEEGTPKRAVVLLSGGMDSATAAYEARERGYEIYALHTSYGQRTEARELECARRLAEELTVADFCSIETSHLSAIGASSLTDDEMAVADADTESDEIPSSYVPFRNANLLSMAVAYAEANDCGAVFIGAHSEDFSGYPDCRPEFFDAFEQVVDVGTKPETEISIEAPFVEWSKTDIADRGLDLGVPYEHTWSCYRENEPACGTCDACAFRLQAFQRLDVRDPIEYGERPSYTDES
ncbi:7-cyano-7-deazaguanine synthase QueC [Salinadaptatus halalkaliphilus]|uniref:7-cyano-7-deazaguanine synthase n=1 Tax=Salinadaptatus halalkaliphilus TaxID=2419781 RepID=A0A4V3VKZ2_9EURY|nr:7-cyano-7-deazaguanine synthase QueC [Salinadaptatus halalkaliphilus]THE63577.1 7-cyano-7-deazaguanine synthase QueC [Salinadaptatus halalkaliphilus]